MDGKYRSRARYNDDRGREKGNMKTLWRMIEQDILRYLVYLNVDQRPWPQ
jgi:hypothetical protein